MVRRELEQMPFAETLLLCERVIDAAEVLIDAPIILEVPEAVAFPVSAAAR